ncbi:hypothetical protein [Aquisediminimonas profunda]|uniref:hypothetical protein n=1 Tax=Aquisediminimonas profunda TaxID=1550733 RepID=UPI001C638FD2|nr:hypothetical protein [Aquisediminimonas profunda]
MECEQAQFSNSTDDEDQEKSARRFVGWAMGLPFVAFVARETFGGRTTLLTELPTPLQWVACLAGLALGGVVAQILAQRSAKTFGRSKAIFAAISLIALSVVTFSYLGRWAFELASFANLETEIQSAQVRIMGVRTGKSGTFAAARLFPDGREVDVPITNELYADLAATRPPLWSKTYSEELFCLTLPQQNGRWGAIRAYVPARWDDGLSHFEDCHRQIKG